MAEHERVDTQSLSCEECKRPWSDPDERWRVYVTDDEPAASVAYCPRCAEREFGQKTSPAP